MIKKIKKNIYQIKQDLMSVFGYHTHKISSQLDVTRHYDEYWRKKRGQSLGALSEWQKDRADIILNLLPRDRDISLSDVGCGDGSIIAYLKSKRHRDGDEFSGFDASDDAIQVARNNGLDVGFCDLGKDPELGFIKKADFITFLEVLEHMPNPEQILGRAFEVADKGVIFSVPNTGYYRHRFRLLFGKFPVQWVLMPNEHLRFWTLTDMKWWLSVQGFKNFKIISYQGVPVLNKIWPSMFAAGLLIMVNKQF